MTEADPITTTVTLADLRDQYDDELAEFRDAFEEVVEHAREEYGDRAEWPDAVRQTAEAYEEAGKSIQRRQHALDRFADEYGDGAFEVKMLSGAELMSIESDLRTEAAGRDVDPETLSAYRQQLTVDAATVDAPAGVPTDDDGPLPSECPNPLTLSLYDVVERLNTAGAADFRAPGFGDETDGEDCGTSASPMSSLKSSSVSEEPDGGDPLRGDSS